MEVTFRKKMGRRLRRQKAQLAKNKEEWEEEKKQELQKKIRRQLYANASRNKKLEKEVQMKKVCKHYPRNRKYLGIAQVNYDFV